MELLSVSSMKFVTEWILLAKKKNEHREVPENV